MDKTTKSITITQYDYLIRNVNDEEIDIHGHPNHYTEFDREGRPQKEIRYNRLGEFEEMFEYGYDDHGNLVEELYCLDEHEVAEKKTFIRNEEGVIIRALKHYQDGSVDTIAFEYNAEGHLVKKTTTNDDDEVEQVETFEWENGELSDHAIFDENGDPVEEPDFSSVKPNQTRLSHNEKGQVVTEEELDEDGEPFMTVNRQYDEDGRPTEVDVVIDGQGKAISRHYFLKYEYTFFE
jgi:YD repeat-containing protein